MTYQVNPPAKSGSKRGKLMMGVLAIIGVCLAFAIGVLVGHFAIPNADQLSNPSNDFLRDEDDKISQLFMDAVDPKNIEKTLEHLTSRMHRAGTPGGDEVAKFIHDSLVNYGLDKVEYEEYDVMLSYPNDTNPDQIALVHSNTGEILINISNGRSKMLVPDEEAQSANADIRWNAFAKAGQVITPKLVYANYATQQDFDYLINTANMNLTGSVILARYRKLWRGAKVQLAEKYGAIGVLLFSDPADETYQNRTDPNSTYPNTIYMPSTAVQRGLVSYLDMGDILTPQLPSKDYVIRHDIEDAYKTAIITRLPVTPISYGDAEKLLGSIGGELAPSAWRGGLSVPYRLGPDMKWNQSIKLSVGTYPEQRIIRNVMGYIRGDVEPDRYVVIGNHHDAWTYGAVDPSSGTAVMMEVARALANVRNQTAWRPRRTIVFCAWDGEEYGLIGSSEFVEQYLRRLESKAIAYLNVDCSVTGNETIWAKSVPLLKKPLFQAAMKVENPNPHELQEGRKTVYDTWLHQKPSKTHQAEPWLDSIGSGSDYRHFLDYAGIASLDFRYTQTADRSYPLYHTLYETMHLARLTDPTFVYHQAVARMWGEMTRSLADSLFIPFNVTDYGYMMVEYVDDLEKVVRNSSASSYANIKFILEAGKAFLQATVEFDEKLSQLLNTDNYEVSQVRIINDQLMHLERMFILPFGLPGRSYLRHVIFAPSIADTYSGVNFAGIIDTLKNIEENLGSNNTTSKYSKILNDQISWVAHCIYSAVDLLKRDL